MTMHKQKQILRAALPPPIAEAAIRNAEEANWRAGTSRPNIVTESFDNASDIIFRGFIWEGTKEGNSFWQSVKDHLGGHGLNPMPRYPAA